MSHRYSGKRLYFVFYGYSPRSSSESTIVMMNKYVVILNYATRGMVVLIGLAWVSGLFPALSFDPNVRMFGIVFILFGAYRLATFWSQHQEYKRYNNDND